MSDIKNDITIKDFSLRIEEELLRKLHYVARHEDRSANGELLQLIRRRITDFERDHGPIDTRKTVASRARSGTGPKAGKKKAAGGQKKAPVAQKV